MSKSRARRISLLAVFMATTTGCVSTAGVIAEKTMTSCGATFSLQRGDATGSDLYAVSVYPEAGRTLRLERFPTQEDVQRYIDANADLLQKAQNNIGTYCERASGDCLGGAGALTCYLDISRTETSLERAVALARACNQRSIARLGRDGLTLVDAYDGKPLGDGKELTGAALEACALARR